MKYIHRFRAATILPTLLLGVLLTASPTQAQDGVAAKLDKLMARLPVGTVAEKDRIAGDLLKLGEAGVRELCGRISHSDEPLDGKVCSTLHGLVHAAAKAGAEQSRRMVAGVLCEVLRSDATIAAKSHLIGELRTLGGSESVSPVSALLKEKELCEPAAQTLVAIGSEDAAAALRNALPELTDGSRVTVVYALGRMRDRGAVALMLKEAASTDAAVRQAALFSLAEIGDPLAEAVLRKAAAAKDDSACERATHGLLRFAIRLAENGHKPEAIGVLRSLLAQAGPDDPGIAPGAFYELMAMLNKDEAVPEIVAGLGHDSARVRTAALRAAARLTSAEVTKQLAAALVNLPSQYRPPVAELLRQRGDPAALESAVQALAAKDKSVRLAAISAIGGLGKRDVAPRLISFLDKSPEEAQAARAALISMGDKDLNGALVKALPQVTPAARCGLLTVLAARDAAGHRDVFLAATRDQAPPVRHAALKILGAFDDPQVVTALMKRLAVTNEADERTVVEQSLLAACRQLSAASHKDTAEQLIAQYRVADVPVRCALVNAVRAMAEGYPAGLAYVRSSRKDDSPEVRSVALRALAEWPTPEPMTELLSLAQETKDLTEYVLALRGSIRMAGQAASSMKEADRDKAFEVLKAAMAAARRPEEKKQVLAVVSTMDHGGALEIAAGCLDDAALSGEATAAVLKIVARAGAQPIDVLVAYDKRVTRLPDWLSDWSDTETDLNTTDTGFRLYAKTYDQGEIQLGGNRGEGASSHYLIILRGDQQHAPTITAKAKAMLEAISNADLRKQVAALLAKADTAPTNGAATTELRVAKVATGAGCKVVKHGLKTGARVYVDRDYTFEDVPAELAGATYIMTANDDKRRADNPYLILRRGTGSADDSKAMNDSKTPAPPSGKPTAGAPVPVVLDGELVTEYHYADADRPFFYPVIAPTGDNITRNWPMKDVNKDEEHDHPHHRSLWFTHGNVNGHDFWSEGRGPKIVQTKLTVDQGKSRCVIVTEDEWRTKEGEVVCTDSRRHTIWKSGDNRIFDFEITIKASHGDVVFGDTKEGSMAVRVAPTLRTSGKVAQGHMVNSEGGSGKGIWGQHANWCDYYGPLNGKVVGIAMMDHPDNPRHPTTWHARDYGLCAANPFGLSFFEKKPKGAGNLEIKKGESVTFKYRVLVHNGTAEEAGVEKLYQAYAKGPESHPIFNGKDLTGWTVPEGNIWWAVHDGMISAKSGPNRKGSILWTDRKYRDFIIETEFRFGEGTIDSGIFLRTAKQQVQIGISGSLKRDMTGSVYVPGRGYPHEAKGVKELLKLKDWNAMKVEAEGSIYTIWLNGQQVLRYEAQQAIDEGPIGLQLHPGKVMAIDFRNIRLTELN